MYVYIELNTVYLPKCRGNNDMDGIQIKELRKKTNLTQEQLADKMDISKKLVQNWESGKTIPAAKYHLLLRIVFSMGEPDSEIDEVEEAIEKGASFSGTALKMYRECKRLTQKELGQKLEISEQQIQSWEYESRNPKLENILKLAKALGISAKRLYIQK